MIESQYTQAIHKKLPKHIYKWKILDALAGGVPDAFYRNLKSQNGKPLWIEYKFIKELPKRDDTLVTPKLTKQQQIWLRQAHEAGENVWVILGIESIKRKNNSLGFIFTSPDEWEAGYSSNCIKNELNLRDYVQISNKIVEVTS